ncbi:Cobalamin biosynthesis protein BluB [Rhodovulum sp. P5]|uniref:5,6-dimethylbenzimidazole synthase n=1 Tax=Rhodovulum sp. P5 TaxID=1564506 RepID=UPI0009C2585C|nr:5,6-dimethylbenzimidazole synthase [Rhodovulum sp. P5]ARE41105.1 Cobalamin biosynthesis protein BluB [Rhodovulum sp. P5]
MVVTDPLPHRFDHVFRDELFKLMRWRRDVRHFRSTPVDEDLLEKCLKAVRFAPSVGLSEPWRFLRLKSPEALTAARENFEFANAEALLGYKGEKAALYPRLKLSGMDEAPVQLAVFCDDGTEKGAGLGAATMPEMRRYSVVCSIAMFWLAARAEGLGVGWVSVLDPERLARDLNAPESWKLVAYLCVGWPALERDQPELEEIGWEMRDAALHIEER